MFRKSNLIFNLLIVGAVLLLFAGGAIAKAPDYVQGSKFAKPAGSPSQTLSNISNWAYWLYWDGKSANDPLGNSGGIYPRGTAGVIFMDGFIWGGYLEGDSLPRVGGQTYNIGTVPGWINPDGTPADPNDPAVRIYRIRKDYQTLTFDQVKQDAAEQLMKNPSDVTEEDAQKIIQQYATDWDEWPVEHGAPFIDKDGDGVYTKGVDEPGIADADQVVWFVANDLDASATTALYGSQPIGLELQVTAWAYNQPSGTLGQLIFKKYKIINKSGKRIDSMFVAQWCDPDVGNYTDDYVGCDSTLSLGYAYSAYLTDDEFSAFGLPPAAVGYDFFQGPRVYTGDLSDTAVFDLKYWPGYKNLPMISFGYFAAGSSIPDPTLGDYEGTKQWYNLLNGFIPTDDLENPSPFTHGYGALAGKPTKFPVNGDPFLGIGDIDGKGSNIPPGDRRMSMSSGPFTMQPGDTQEVVVAVIGGIVAQQGGNNLNAVAQLKLNDQFAQFVYDKLFQGVPKPPKEPVVKVSYTENQVSLNWGFDSDAIAETEAPDTVLGFKFEGYNVYQLPGPVADKSQAKLLATFDVKNGLLIIRGKKFIPEFGDIVEVPIQKGTDSGIQRYFIVEKDYINDRPLYAGSKYYFAVTAYNYNPDPSLPEPSLESTLNPIEVIPQPVKPGERISDIPGSDVEVTKIGSSTGYVQVKIIDPTALTGHDYKVTFNEEKEYTVADSDTVGVWHKWNLIDVTENKVLLADQTNLEGGEDYLIVDGLLVKVVGSKLCGLADWDYEGNRWVSGVNWGGSQFFGGLDMGMNFFGSTLKLCDIVPVRLEFQDKEDVEANGFISEGPVYRRDLGYAYAGTGKIPFAAFDVSDPDNPRRLNIAFVEMDGMPSMNDTSNHIPANGIWDMGWHELPGDTGFAELGGREYIFIMNSDYNGGVDYDDNNWAPAADVLYGIWPKNRGNRPYLLAKFTMDIIANIPNGPDDIYEFSTGAYVAYNKDLAKNDVEKINVFPNPYYAFNPQATNRFDRFVTFNHLPKKATIRIFDLGGTQVRKLEKNDDSQFLKWDLKNESGLPVASGIYIAHIDMPDLGKTKVLKVFIIQADQIIQYY